MNMRVIIIALAGLWISPCLARTIIVDDNGPADFSTIQTAIDNAINGDVVEVQSGTYTGNGNRDIDFHGKAITIMSKDGPDNCIIDCQDLGRGFYFHSAEDANSVVEGLTVINGYALDGAGIYCNGASPTVTNCEFLNGTSTNWGGGICCYEASPVISDCTFMDNSAFEGGAVTTRSDWYVLCAPLIKNCLISGNTCSGSGGGINSDCLSTPTISNCVIIGNFAGTYGGGGVSIYQSNPTITNCLIAGNTTDNGGGGVLCWYPDGMETRPSIKNCTITDNSALNFGGGIYADRQCTLNISNSIIWNNNAGLGWEIAILRNPSWQPSTFTLSYCDISSDEMETWVEPGCTLNWGQGNIDADPCFADPYNSDYHLQSQAGRWDSSAKMWVQDANTSVCIDAGDPNSDWTKELWPNGKRINMGAYGGTPEASLSLSAAGNIANLDNDPCDTIDLNDLAVFVNKWCYEEYLLAEDLDRNGHVDFNDFAIFARQYDETHAEFNISYNIGSCIEGISQISPLYQTEQTRFTVTVEGRRIHFEDMMVANCCAQYLWLEMEVIDNLIIIYEHEYFLNPCFCICNYPVDARIGPFEEGTYTVEVYEDFGGFIGSTTVTIE